MTLLYSQNARVVGDFVLYMLHKDMDPLSRTYW